MKETVPFGLANPLAELLDKPREEFTRSDLLAVIERKGIERITFHYTALDGKLKELKLPVLSRAQADEVLAMGERADGSSLFKGMVDMGLSDVYVVPEYRTAFINPFDPFSLDFICRYLTRTGEPVAFALDNILIRAAQSFKERSGLELRALGELEFFLLSQPADASFPGRHQRGYHEAMPFVKTGHVLDEMLSVISRLTGAVKYGHSEVGFIDRVTSDLEEVNGRRAEQMELEFLPRPVEEMADDLVLSRWVIRNIAFRNGLVATFAPKLEEGVAGNGLHFHLELLKEGRSVMTDAQGELSSEARRLIGGLCGYAESLTAFGNTMASSYLRLVPNQEAPTRVCWSDLNRSVLIRVPLGWTRLGDLAGRVNPREKTKLESGGRSRQTVELRSPDGSALIHLILAGITAAACWAFSGGREEGRDALELAEKLYVKGNIFQDKKLLAQLPVLPSSCAASGRLLLKKRELYEQDGIFPPSVVEYMAGLLLAEEDEALQQRISTMPEDQRLKFLRRVMHRDLHRH